MLTEVDFLPRVDSEVLDVVQRLWTNICFNRLASLLVAEGVLAYGVWCFGGKTHSKPSLRLSFEDEPLFSVIFNRNLATLPTSPFSKLIIKA